MMNSSRKVVLITGTSSGLGLEMAVSCARSGFQVVATMRDLARRGGLEKRLADEGLEAHIERCDVVEPESRAECVDRVVEKFGGIYGLVNNAGYGLFSPIELASMEKIRSQMETNFFGLVGMCQAVLPVMRKQREGRIINISSVAGVVAFPIAGYYNASKFAVEGFSEALSHEVRPFNIQVSLIQPGRFHTDFASRSLVSVSHENAGDYAGMILRMSSRTGQSARSGPPGRVVGDLTAQVLKSPSPRLRYRAGWDSYALSMLKLILPRRVLNLIIDFVFHRGSTT